MLLVALGWVVSAQAQAQTAVTSQDVLIAQVVEQITNASEAGLSSAPLVEKKQNTQGLGLPEGAKVVNFVDSLTQVPNKGFTTVPLAAGKVLVWLDENDAMNAYLWPDETVQAVEESQAYMTDTPEQYHFQALIEGESYLFSFDFADPNDSVGALEFIAVPDSIQESIYGIDYERESRGNYIIKNILLAAEAELAEYMKNIEGYTEEEIAITLR